MNIPWEKFLVSAAVGFSLLTILKPKTFLSNQGFFGFSGPQVGTSADVQTPNCTPANMSSNGLATYCNPPGVECAQGVDCADARAQYCRRYARGGVCMDYGQVAPNQGLPGQGPITGSPFQDIANSFGFNPATGFGSYAPSTIGYGYQPVQNPYYFNPYQPGGFGYGYGYPQQSYGYGYSQPSYGYGYQTPPYYYNPYQRRAYAVTGYDKKSGHFLYG